MQEVGQYGGSASRGLIGLMDFGTAVPAVNHAVRKRHFHRYQFREQVAKVAEPVEMHTQKSVKISQPPDTENLNNSL